jgi:hypothetical protein
MSPDKLKNLVKDEFKILSARNKPKTGQEVLDLFLDAMMNVIAPYLNENQDIFNKRGFNF